MRQEFSGLNTVQCQAVIIVETPFLKSYVSVDKLLVAADGLLATSTLLFAVSSYPAALFPLFSIFVLLLFRCYVL